MEETPVNSEQVDLGLGALESGSGTQERVSPDDIAAKKAAARLSVIKGGISCSKSIESVQPPCSTEPCCSEEMEKQALGATSGIARDIATYIGAESEQLAARANTVMRRPNPPVSETMLYHGGFNEFTLHQMKDTRRMFVVLARYVELTIPDNRSRSRALSAIEDGLMHAIKAICLSAPEAVKEEIHG